MTMEIQPPRPSPYITFTNANFKGVSPHDNDLIVISVVLMRFNIQHILFDGGSLTDVMY